VAVAVIGWLIAKGVTAVWLVLPPFGAIVVYIGTLALLSVAVALVEGWIQVPAKRARLWIGWAVRQAPFTARDLARRRSISRGREHKRWSTLAAFELEDPRRFPERDQPHRDYGLRWRDAGQSVSLTHVLTTGEVIAVSGDGHVELLATIQSAEQVEALLADYDYAGLFDHRLRWVRFRLVGWAVPLPPHAQWWYERDHEPLRPWPQRPPSSVGREQGAYHGRRVDMRHEVVIVDEAGSRPLFHAVDISPTGFSWGYSGQGPTDLARSLLLDRLDYAPHDHVVIPFRDDIVAALPADSFVLTYQVVDAWIDAHRQLFAREPRGVPIDPYAAGGAYRDD